MTETDRRVPESRLKIRPVPARLWFVASLVLLFPVGCASMWDELNPRRLNKLNQGPPPPEMRDFTLRPKSLDVQFAKWRPPVSARSGTTPSAP